MAGGYRRCDAALRRVSATAQISSRSVVCIAYRFWGASENRVTRWEIASEAGKLAKRVYTGAVFRVQKRKSHINLAEGVTSANKTNRPILFPRREFGGAVSGSRGAH
jgi:hypothetical protein